MRHGVVSGRMASAFHTLCCQPSRWMGNAVTDREECGGQASLVESAENLLGVAGNGAVVEGERDGSHGAGRFRAHRAGPSRGDAAKAAGLAAPAVGWGWSPSVGHVAIAGGPSVGLFVEVD